MTFTEFYNDRIISSLQSYESAGLIDEMSVYDWVVRALKRFGTLNSVLQEEVLTIKNNQATLPQNFIKLKLAVKCTPSKYFVDKVDDSLQQSRWWIERHEIGSDWGDCDTHCPTETTEKKIIEKLYYKGNSVTYFYNEPIVLKVIEGVKKKQCTSDCINLKSNSSYSVSIMNGGRKLQTNFNTDKIFIQYYGYEIGDDDLIEIPDTNQGHLIDYLEYFCKSKIMENIIGNGDNTKNEVQMMQLYQMKERDMFSLAMTDAKASLFTKEAFNKVKRNNRLSRLSHEFAFKI